GDTIEIRGNGPFISPPVSIRGTALTIRAADGFRPVIRLSPEPTDGYLHLLKTDSPLVLEGLEFQAARPKTLEPGQGKVGIHAGGALFHAANCQFLLPRRLCIWVVPQTRRCVARNCAFRTSEGSGAIVGSQDAGGQWLMDNCVHVGEMCAVRCAVAEGAR